MGGKGDRGVSVGVEWGGRGIGVGLWSVIGKGDRCVGVGL